MCAFQNSQTYAVASEIVFAKSAKNSMVWLEWRAQSARVSRAIAQAKGEARDKEGEGSGEKARCLEIWKFFSPENFWKFKLEIVQRIFIIIGKICKCLYFK